MNGNPDTPELLVELAGFCLMPKTLLGLTPRLSKMGIRDCFASSLERASSISRYAIPFGLRNVFTRRSSDPSRRATFARRPPISLNLAMQLAGFRDTEHSHLEHIAQTVSELRVMDNPNTKDAFIDSPTAHYDRWAARSFTPRHDTLPCYILLI